MKNDVTVMTARVMNFKDAELNKYMNLIDKAQMLGKRSAFEVGKNVVKILEKECWKEDFKTEADLAEYLGYKPAMISHWKGAVKYISTHKDAEKRGYTLERAYMLQRLDDKGKLHEFEKWCTDNKVACGTDRALKDAITHFNGGLTAEEKKNAIDAEVTEVKTATAKSNTLEGAVKVVTIEFEGTVFSVPEKEFKALMKKYAPKQSGKKAKS